MLGLGLLKGLGVTIAELPKRKVTIQYPEVKPQWPERYRGIHEFVPDLCIVCYQCSRVCPTDCISLTGQRDENKKMRIDTFDVNFEICILCDLCCEVCPTEAIKMTGTFELAAYTRDDFFKDMQWLYDNHVEHGTYKERQALLSASKESVGDTAAHDGAPAGAGPPGGDA